jgi:SPP1 family predicted phage head-tail adaptor
MKIASMRSRVTLQRKAVTTDEVGNQIETWIDYQTVWAAMAPISGREYYAASQINAEVSSKFLFRYLPEITPDMRILFGSRVFEVVSVMDVEGRKRLLELLCKEKIAGES